MFLFLGILLSSPAEALSLIQSSEPSTGQPAATSQKQAYDFCEIPNSIEVPSEGAANPCGEAVKSVQKRAAYWLQQAKGKGNKSKGCRHFQTVFQFAAAKYHQAKAACQDTSAVKSGTEGAMLRRNEEGQEVKDAGSAQLTRCASGMEEVQIQANNQLVRKNETKGGFRDAYTAADLEASAQADLKKMKGAKAPALKDARQAQACQAVLRDSLRAMESIQRFYGEGTLGKLFSILGDQASMERDSASGAQKELKAISEPPPQPLRDDDPRWAR
jgi:hypothetical protein